jgi:hypothetical protein
MLIGRATRQENTTVVVFLDLDVNSHSDFRLAVYIRGLRLSTRP